MREFAIQATHRPGEIGRIANALAKAGVNLKSVAAVAFGNQGVVRVVPDDVEAKLARPERIAVNIMGDAAFGMVGMDFETAVRCRIPILTIVLNNGMMGGYGEWMPEAVARYEADRLGGRYAEVASALGGHAERVERPDELRPALERATASMDSGRAALVEVLTHEESVFAGA